MLAVIFAQFFLILHHPIDIFEMLTHNSIAVRQLQKVKTCC